MMLKVANLYSYENYPNKAVFESQVRDKWKVMIILKLNNCTKTPTTKNKRVKKANLWMHKVHTHTNPQQKEYNKTNLLKERHVPRQMARRKTLLLPQTRWPRIQRSRKLGSAPKNMQTALNQIDITANTCFATINFFFGNIRLKINCDFFCSYEGSS